jgi:hypothetical protein
MKSVEEMTEQEKASIRAWIANWRELGPILEKLRAESIRNAETVSSMEALDSAFDHAATTLPARESSGLIEQQAIFSRARRCGRTRKTAAQSRKEIARWTRTR